ncbi:hypothetical protein KZX46_20310 [Polymorphobacter sp. PAMC 29334]|uniref:right-handed parallel beta-helix repeat-containing protein n=1 Tax=Polymorphobacter sp. PAMC 29334 TaxID=2862331 RepID=UPI001C75783F|nr:right-handed parallel beta-helix repeat-containing protein [Polymorphobacter sp. PAMC 29334]QYE35035.1 hypothetical protein KZX46_20310 [Polymorphobacter sp. PAMC 29334]
MIKVLPLTIVFYFVAMLAPADAKTVTATYDTFDSVISTVQGGDTINLVGDFQLMRTQNYSFSSPVIINASAATFHRTWTLRDVNNLSIQGGTFDFHPVDALYAAALEVYDSNNISVDRTLFTDDGGHDGALFSSSTNISVTNSKFNSLSHSIGLKNVDGANLYNNLTIGTTVDGFDIAGSQNVVASHNSCIDGAPQTGAHPDCIQIYGIVDGALSSNITLSDNLAFGATQGFTKFVTGGAGTNISMIRNLVETTYSQGIACYDCFASNISDNLLVTLAASPHFVNLNIIGGANNTVGGNVFEDIGRVALYRPVLGSIWHDAGVIPWGAGALEAGIGLVPEPSVWASLIAGFAAVGWALRASRRRLVLA